MSYTLLKNLHVLTAVITAVLFGLRLGLDAIHRPWRQTALRWIPHVNDTVLLAAGLGLWVMGGWNPLNQYWLGAKIGLLVLYILAGKQALDLERDGQYRVAAAAFALLVLALIFTHALLKPW